ncbi:MULTISPECIES: SDR family NAD(P)-dependent oxidoreductase [unclassified Paenibacillus]|uniref:SDR family NAD(P)-dependent oxidoreductase n=1 Tax=unclassified Paenibacillus TaxID=185978 RepID=UPI002F414AF6
MLKDKVVFITGASSGLGAAVALQASRQGAIVILTGRHSERLERAAALLDGEYAIFQLDVTDMQQIEQVVTAVILRYGRIDILLNNAGYGQFLSLEDMPVEGFAQMMDTNYLGIVRCTKIIVPYMRLQGSGHIINIASMAGKIGSAKSTAYSASKHAVLGFTNALRMELKGGGIKVSAINPGPIDTQFFELADPEGSYVKNVQWFMMKTDKVASRVVSVMNSGRAELDLPLLAAIGIKIYGLFPRLADRLAGRLFNQK